LGRAQQPTAGPWPSLLLSVWLTPWPHAMCHHHLGPACKWWSRRLHPQAAELAPFLHHHRQILIPIFSFLR
jgi:hypothetical protein